MRKDVILDQYARMYEIPRQLALRGHNVLGLCLDYKNAGPLEVEDRSANGRLRWRSYDAGPMAALGGIAYPGRVLRLLREFGPDMVMAASDAPHVILGSWLSRRLGVPFVADLYDNFESFGLTRWLGLLPLYRRSVAAATLTACVSEKLARRVRDHYKAKGAVMVLESTVDTGVFYQREKLESRSALGLPLEGRLIGTAGALFRSRGVDVLYRAFDALRKERRDVSLVLAGTEEPSLPRPSGPGVYYLGELNHSEIPVLFSALDVGVICLRETAFGEFSFPQKAYEMLACGLPVVAADVGAMSDLLSDTSNSLYRPDDALSLRRCLESQLDAPALWHRGIPTWADAGVALDRAMSCIVNSR